MQETTDRKTVHVVEDDVALADALAVVLRQAGFEVRVYSETAAFLDGYVDDGPACLVLDVHLPGRSGLELQELLASRAIHVPIVMMTGRSDVPTAVRAMKAGAIDFLIKPFDEQQLTSAVQAAFRRQERSWRADRQASELHERLHRLTARERSILEGIAAGRLNKQIAEQLGLSEITVKVYRRNVMRKMGAHTLAELLRMYERLAANLIKSN
jgi:FixJ family two-component response regulator